MEHIEKRGIYLTGIALKKKTTNENGQSGIDCGNLWQEFEKKNIPELVKDKLSSEIYAVYYDYEGDHTKPFAYFIGCPVPENAKAPEGLEILHIPQGSYQLIEAKGKMPDCVIAAWQQIWKGRIPRAYRYDFEVYDSLNFDWQNVKVNIFLSVK
jgi:predicted transcriptional regulator YdeE